RNEDLGPSVLRKLKCRCGMSLSKPKIESAPPKKPIAEGSTRSNPSPGVISIAGANRDQKLAAIITPPVNPNMPLRSFLLEALNRKTLAAPNAVNPQVNKPANSAAVTWCFWLKYSMMVSNMHSLEFYSK